MALHEITKIETLLAEARDTLAAVSDSPALDAELLLCLALDVPRSYLFAHPDDEADVAAAQRFANLIERRAGGIPMAYITGSKEFWSLSLMVSPATLVPRPETEILVERALREIPRDAAWKILDLGTGSGAIALAIASERPRCTVLATDISKDSLAVARLNARQLDLPNVSFLQGDWAEPCAGEIFDLIVCNPPYVRSGDSALERLAHEPQQALVAGPEGLDAIWRIATECRSLLAPGSLLLLEHGNEQEDAVAEVLRNSDWSLLECIRDLAGLPRVSVASAGTDP